MLPGTDQSHSSVFVPIVGSHRVLGAIVMENYERENAFRDAEVRLLSTVAASMGVALENARLFDETQRLLKETEQRAAELAVINRIQEGMAAELDFQSIVDTVGDKLREVFKRRHRHPLVGSEKAGPSTSSYEYEHGKRRSRRLPHGQPGHGFPGRPVAPAKRWSSENARTRTLKNEGVVIFRRHTDEPSGV